MILLFGITLIILGLILFILKGFFGIFPDNWEWVGLALAVVGVAMGTPGILQTAIGRPFLLLESYEYLKDNEKILQVLIKNPPLRNPICRLFGIRRDTLQSLTASYRIAEGGSGRIIVPIRHARIYSDDDPTDEGKYRVALPPTYSVAASIVIAIWDSDINKAFVPSDRQRQPLELVTGLYKVTIIISVEGENKYVTGEFVVGDDTDSLIWAKPVQSIPNKIRSNKKSVSEMF